MSKEKKSCCSGCLVKVLGAMLVIAFIGIVGFNIIQRTLIPNNNAKPKLWERVATIHDIELEESYSFPVSISLKVVPKEDIKDLTIQINYLDPKQNVIKTDYHNFGNVEKAKTYSTKINITDFGITEIFTIEKCEFSVYSGTVSLI